MSYVHCRLYNYLRFAYIKEEQIFAGKIIAIVVVPSVLHLFVLLGLIRAYRQLKKSKDETSGRLSLFSVRFYDINWKMTALVESLTQSSHFLSGALTN